MPIRPRRSALYMPGSNARALEKAKTLPADALIFDLEDAVAPDAKDAARDQAVAAVTAGGYGKREIAIRVNALTTPWGEADLRAVAGAGADAILIPKVETPGHLEAARSLLRREGIAPTQALWAMMETPLAILNAAAIAAASPGEFPLTVLVMGTNDLAKETRVPLGRGRMGMLSWLSTCSPPAMPTASTCSTASTMPSAMTTGYAPSSNRGCSSAWTARRSFIRARSALATRSSARAPRRSNGRARSSPPLNCRKIRGKACSTSTDAWSSGFMRTLRGEW